MRVEYQVWDRVGCRGIPWTRASSSECAGVELAGSSAKYIVCYFCSLKVSCWFEAPLWWGGKFYVYSWGGGILLCDYFWQREGGRWLKINLQSEAQDIGKDFFVVRWHNFGWLPKPWCAKARVWGGGQVGVEGGGGGRGSDQGSGGVTSSWWACKQYCLLLLLSILWMVFLFSTYDRQRWSPYFCQLDFYTKHKFVFIQDRSTETLQCKWNQF